MHKNTTYRSSLTNKNYLDEIVKKEMKDTQEDIEFMKVLQQIGFAQIWKEFYYPETLDDVFKYLKEKDNSLISILNDPLLWIQETNRSEQKKDKQLVRHKPFFINALMNEREQLIVLKSWLENIRNNDTNNKERTAWLRKNYLIITFILSELTDQMKHKCNPRGEIMMEIKGIIAWIWIL